MGDQTPARTRLAVLGSPIEHSRSPVLHAAAYRQLGLDWSYTAFEVTSDQLDGFLRSRDAAWRGLSLTYPLKVDVLPMLDAVDRVARLTYAANTVCFDGGHRRGYNTDVGGIVRTLREGGLADIRHGVLIGAGATAASAIAAMAELGALEVRVYARSPERAAALIELGSALGVVVRTLPIAELERAAAADLVVCAIPGGAELGVAASAELVASAVLLDVAYDPWPTTIANEWFAADGRVVHGLGMLLHQALLQVRVFVTGDPVTALDDESAVLRVMRESLA